MPIDKDEMNGAMELINAMVLVDELSDCPRTPTHAEIDNLRMALLRLMQVCLEAFPDSEPLSEAMSNPQA